MAVRHIACVREMYAFVALNYNLRDRLSANSERLVVVYSRRFPESFHNQSCSYLSDFHHSPDCIPVVPLMGYTMVVR